MLKSTLCRFCHDEGSAIEDYGAYLLSVLNVNEYSWRFSFCQF